MIILYRFYSIGHKPLLEWFSTKKNQFNSSPGSLLLKERFKEELKELHKRKDQAMNMNYKVLCHETRHDTKLNLRCRLLITN
jgi:hypothetical protein